MGLLDIVAGLFGRDSSGTNIGEQSSGDGGVQERVKAHLHPEVQEEITAFLQPRALIERGDIRLGEAEEFFENYKTALEQAITDVYGTSFKTKKEWKGRFGGAYTFSSEEGDVIKYRVSFIGMPVSTESFDSKGDFSDKIQQGIRED